VETARTIAPLLPANPTVTLVEMSPEAAAAATSPSGVVAPTHTITYVVTATEDGDDETGAVLLDGRPMGRLSRRRRSGVTPQPGGTVSVDAFVWHAEAIGWLPHEGRPWDMRVTSSAPTRQRAAEDLLRAFRRSR
jgi:hypothetical protein